MRAKKSLGQHFLKSEKALTQIVDAADPSGDDVILEIGPGTGVLTEKLLFFGGKVVAIEKDRELIPLLQERFSKDIDVGKLDLIKQDVLKFDPSVMKFYKDHPYKLVANIPYYITGAIIEKFLSTEHQPEQMVLLIQKEVAERIVARNKKESVLSIAVKAYSTPRIVAKVPAGAFNPPPKVDSAIISIENISREFFKDCDEGAFFKVLKFIFGKKRKQILGSLADYVKDRDLAAHVLARSGIFPASRPEDLALSDWKRLVIALEK